MTKKQQQQRKVQKRKKQIAQRKITDQKKVIAKKRRAQYPEIIYAGKADPNFMELIKEAIENVNFDRLDGRLREFLKLVAEDGLTNTLQVLKGFVKKDDFAAFRLSMITSFGTYIFDQIPKDLRKSYLPINNVIITPRGRSIYVFFSSLGSGRGHKGRIYYSKQRPLIKIDGNKKVVAFSRHVIERTCERIAPDYTSYLGSGVFSYFAECRHYETCKLHNKQLAFILYQDCVSDEAFMPHRITNQLLGDDYDENQRMYRRIGYCPIVVENEYAKAKTLLLPGFDNTPEYAAVMRSKLTHIEKDRLLTIAHKFNLYNASHGEGLELIKWFHEHGVPQVIQSHEKWYDFNPES